MLQITNAIFFNLIIYFMSNLRREPGPFFFFFFVSFLATLTMSMFFRSLAALSRSLVQALTPAAGLILALVLYTGFALPPVCHLRPLMPRSDLTYASPDLHARLGILDPILEPHIVGRAAARKPHARH